MVYLDDSKVSYRCICGANVFHWIAPEKLECNGCGAVYTVIKKEARVE